MSIIFLFFLLLREFEMKRVDVSNIDVNERFIFFI